MSSPRIELLVVEDEQIVALDLKNHIERMGYAVAGTYPDAESAVDHVSNNRVDLVLMDIQLAGEMDGITAAQIIRQDYRVPVILLTAFADEETIRRAVESEPFAYLVKPFESRELRSAISLAVYRHRMEEAVHNREQLLSTVIGAIEDGIALVGASGTVYYGNAIVENLFGVTSGDTFRWDRLVGTQNSRNDEADTGTTRVVRTDDEGGTRHLDLSVVPLGDPWEGEATNLLVFRDVTQAVNDAWEIQRKTEELFRVQQMEQLHRTAGGMAHDFNNLIAIVQGNAQVALDIARSREQGEDELVESLETVFETAKRAGALTRKLLGFQRNLGTQPVQLDVRQAVVALKPILAHLFDNKDQFRVRIDDPSLRVMIDPTLFDQVVLNLVINARDAVTQKDQVTLSVGAVSFRSTSPTTSGEMPPGEYVRIIVTDTGHGIEPEIQKLIFEPFYSTKLESGGTGLGLSTVATIVKKCGGFVDMTSTVGAGTSVAVYYPRYEPNSDQ